MKFDVRSHRRVGRRPSILLLLPTAKSLSTFATSFSLTEMPLVSSRKDLTSSSVGTVWLLEMKRMQNFWHGMQDGIIGCYYTDSG